MSAVLVRSVLPFVTAVAAASYLVTGVPRDPAPERVAMLAVVQDEGHGCAADRRDAGACQQDAGGQAPARPAGELAASDAAVRRAGR
jgi:hypothetical protein